LNKEISIYNIPNTLTVLDKFIMIRLIEMLV
jgi:hypothetical protein